MASRDPTSQHHNVRPKIPYRLDPRPLGPGSYSTVHRGVHRETNAVAAIKRPKNDEVALARFEREIEVQTQLDHPNVMPIIEYSLEDRWLAMPLGVRSLTRAVEDDHVVSEFELASILTQIVLGLRHAHGKDYMHRDCNPNNIIQMPDGRWMVSDWGLVRKPRGQSSPRLTRKDRPIETRGFVAPETVLDPHAADARCDVYSVGRVAEFVVTETWPYEGFPTPNPGRLWHNFIERCTASSPTERVQSMEVAQRMLVRIRATIRHMENAPDTLECPRCELPMTGARCDRCGTVWD
jgi:serine/threonine protein kinase